MRLVRRSPWRHSVAVGVFALAASLLPGAAFAQVSGVIEMPGVAENCSCPEDTVAFPGLPNTGGGPVQAGGGPVQAGGPPIFLPRTGAPDVAPGPYETALVGGLLLIGLSAALRRRVLARRTGV
jgi:hypothetical protein